MHFFDGIVKFLFEQGEKVGIKTPYILLIICCVGLFIVSKGIKNYKTIPSYKKTFVINVVLFSVLGILFAIYVLIFPPPE